jgi:hypothetical protein
VKTHFRCILCSSVIDFCSCEVEVTIFPWSDNYYVRYVGPWRNPVNLDVELSTHQSKGLWVKAVVTQLDTKSSTATNIIQCVL